MKGHYKKKKLKRGGVAWLLRVPDGINSNGKRVIHNRTIHGGSEKDAIKALGEFAEEVERGLVGATVATDNGKALTGDSTLAEFMPAWAKIRAQRSRNGKPLSQRSVEQDAWVTGWVVKELGDIRINRLRELDVQRACIEWEKALPKAGKKVRARLQTALDDAKRWKLVPYNVVADVAASVCRQDEDRVDEIVTNAAGLRRLRESAVGTRVEAYIAIMCGTGCRPAEPLALRPCDVDFEGGFVSITRSVVRVQPKRKGDPWTAQVKDEPKNSFSRRRIDVPKYVIEAIQRHIDREGLDPERDAQRLIFAHRPGVRRKDGTVRLVDEPWNPDSLGSLHQRIAKDAELDGLTLKGIRKSHAGILIEAEWSPQDVARRLGHARAQTTWNHYIKPRLLKAHAIADALDALESAQPSNATESAA